MAQDESTTLVWIHKIIESLLFCTGYSGVYARGTLESGCYGCVQIVLQDENICQVFFKAYCIMNFRYLILFIFSLLSLVSAVLGFRSMPNKTNKSWQKIILITTMTMASLMILFSGWGAFAPDGATAAAAQRLGLGSGLGAQVGAGVAAAYGAQPS